MMKRVLGKATFAAAALALLFGAVPALAQEIVLIPNRVIYPGETIDLAALKEVTLKPGKVIPPAVVFRAPEIEGKVAKRTLLPGRYIPGEFAARSLARRAGRLGAGHVRVRLRSPSPRPR